jgi:hypothetical protein
MFRYVSDVPVLKTVLIGHLQTNETAFRNEENFSQKHFCFLKCFHGLNLPYMTDIKCLDNHLIQELPVEL